MRFFVALAPLALLALAGPGGAQDDHAHGEEAVLGPDMFTNDTWSYTFEVAGTFDYHCHPHPWMQGSIEVLPSDGSEPRTFTVDVVEPENYEEWTFGPETLSLRVGDTVTFVNGGQEMHKIAQTTGEHAEHIAAAGSTVEPASTDSHDDHEHGSSGPGNPLAWIGLGLLGGVAVAGLARKQSP